MLWIVIVGAGAGSGGWVSHITAMLLSRTVEDGAVGLEEESLDASSISMNSRSGSGAATGRSGSGGGTGFSAALLRRVKRVAKKLLGVTIVCFDKCCVLFPCLRRLERVESISIRTNQ